MKKALWGFALLVDALAIVATIPLLMADAPLSIIVGGIVMISIFVSLLALLIKPQLLAPHASKAVATLSVAIPAILLLGSLDLWRISGQEAFSALIGCLIGWLNWSAFRKKCGDVSQ